MNYETGIKLANEIMDDLKIYCTRMEIAGSLRRKKQDGIHDIEIVCVPRVELMESGIVDVFGNPTMPNLVDHLYETLSILPYDSSFKDYPLQQGPPDKAGKKSPCGPKYYRLFYKKERLDLFAVTPPAQWGVVFAIRTGSAEFSHWLVQQGWNRKLPIKFEDGRMVSRGNFPSGVEYWETPEETDVFRMLEIPFVEPENRTMEWINRNYMKV
jgi:DNA polymerase/3'-5' exonuclease PolX